MLSVMLHHNVGYLVTYLRLLHVFSINKYNTQISWLFYGDEEKRRQQKNKGFRRIVEEKFNKQVKNLRAAAPKRRKWLG